MSMSSWQTTMATTSTPLADLSRLRGISFGGYNVRSLFRKVEDIHLLIKQSNLDCLCINESWLNCSIPSEELNIDGYTLHRSDRDGGIPGCGGSGVAA